MSLHTTMRAVGEIVPQVPAPAVGVSAGQPRPRRIPLLQGVLRRWPSAKNVLTLSLGTAIGQGIGVLSSPILTRLYHPSDIGRLGLFTSFMSVAVVAASFKYELGIVSAANDDEATHLTLASTLITVPIGVLTSALLYISIRFGWFGFAALPLYSIWLMAPAVCLVGAFTALRYLALRQSRFELLSKTSVSQGTARAIAQCLLGWIHPGTFGLLAGELLGRTAGFSKIFRDVWPRTRALIRQATTRDLSRALHRNRKLPIYSLPSSLIDTVIANSPLPIVVALYGSESGGHFALLQKTLALPLALFATSVADSFHNELAICARENPRNMSRVFIKTSAALVVAGSIPAAILFFWGEPLFQVVFGKQWGLAGTLAAICTPWFLSQFVVNPLSRLVFVLRGQEMKLIYDLVLLVSIAAVVIMARYQSFTLFQTVRALSLVNTAGYFIYYAVLAWIVYRSSERTASAAMQQTSSAF